MHAGGLHASALSALWLSPSYWYSVFSLGHAPEHALYPRAVDICRSMGQAVLARYMCSVMRPLTWLAADTFEQHFNISIHFRPWRLRAPDLGPLMIQTLYTTGFTLSLSLLNNNTHSLYNTHTLSFPQVFCGPPWQLRSPRCWRRMVSNALMTTSGALVRLREVQERCSKGRKVLKAHFLMREDEYFC